MDDQQIRFLLLAFALPAAIGLVAGVVIRVAAAKGWSRAAAFGAPLAIGVAYLTAHWVIDGPPRWPSFSNFESRLFLLAAIASVALAAAGASGRMALAWTGLGLVSLAAPVVGMWPIVRRAITSGSLPETEPLLWAVGGVLASILIALSFVQSERERYSRAGVIILAGVCLAAGAALTASHSAKLGQFAFALGAVVAGVGLVVPREKSGTSGRFGPAGLAAASAILAAILVMGGVFAELPTIPAVLLALAPIAGLATGLIPRVNPRWRIPLRVATAAAVAGAAVAVAAIMSAGDGYDY